MPPSPPPIAPGAAIVVLTGAGISKESGLATFRDPDGIWATVRIEDVATPAAFARDPARVHAFYNARRSQLVAAGVAPNPAHTALAELAGFWPGRVLVVTQNIDDLHELAGTTDLIHMHGELLKARGAHCRHVAAWRDALSTALACAHCGRTAGMRPHVVWFGELPLALDEIYGALGACGLFLSIGTSGNVYPAAGFVAAARAAGAHTVELNLEPSEGANLFHAAHRGPATRLVAEYVAALRTLVR